MLTDKQIQQRADALLIVPRLDQLTRICEAVITREGKDAQLAPIWAEKLRHTYQKVLETKYPQYAAANGDVLPIDSSMAPADLVWEYYTVDGYGYADWIDDDGQIAPSSAIVATRHIGYAHDMGHKWTVTVFDLEREAKSSPLPMNSFRQKLAKRAHDAKTNWVWLFGDSEKSLPGLCNHPNLPVTLAPQNSGATSRLWSNKTNDEILEDVALLIDTVAQDTLEQYHAAEVFMPHSLIRLCRNRKIAGTADAKVSLWDVIKDTYKGDDTGQGKVTFKGLNEADASRRLHPKSNTDESGIVGDFMLALPPANIDELCFVRARPYTQRAPQERDMVMHHMTHSKIGGCKMQVPTSCHMLRFGTT